MDEFVISLKKKEKELIVELEKSPLFKQLESLRGTIQAFESKAEGRANGQMHKIADTGAGYDSANMTWKQRVLFIIKQMGGAGVGEIIRELIKREPTHDKVFLTKRAGVTVIQLKQDKKVRVEKIDGRNKYFVMA